jgi:hypothetical protein
MQMFDFPLDKLAALSSIYDSAGLQVVFDIMEKFCDKAENDFIGTSPSDSSGVLSAHAIMHAQRKYFQDITAKIDFLISQHRASDKKDTASKRATAIK